MKTTKLFILIFSTVLTASGLSAQSDRKDTTNNSHILKSEEYERLIQKPSCLEQYIPNQTGPLFKIGSDENNPPDSTFRVLEYDVPSDSIIIHGWLYLPLGDGKYPLIVLTNGGGDGSRAIKSMSDFMAPIFAHCGIAAFVHDKRGTGKSGGIFRHTTYEDYIRDAGNCGIFFSHHKNINPEIIGIMGASEGGRVAVVAAGRYPVFKFVISQAGTVVSAIDDRLYAQMGYYKNSGTSDSLIQVIMPLWSQSFEAWASNDPLKHTIMNNQIDEFRKSYKRDLLPFKKEEMDTIQEFNVVLPTWNSLQYDYLSELKTFNKKWLAIFGDVDLVVPTQASIENIKHFMDISGNKNYTIAILPRCGHTPIDKKTNRRIPFENLMINWMNINVLNKKK
jgi:pimeloyl-ACP methyl ester carboxylesterase